MNSNINRQIILDTETTGMNKSGLYYEGHKIIEIGAVEIMNRRLTGRHLHFYLKPNRLIDPEAFNVHGISDAFLADKPTFADVVDEFLQFVQGSELVIHNAPFDIGFIDHEFSMLNRGILKINTLCKVTDSLLLARKIFPGKRNNLDALCERYQIDKSQRIFHGALLDAEILSDIFLKMTGGQVSIDFFMKDRENRCEKEDMVQIYKTQHPNSHLKILYANNQEILAHEQELDRIQRKNGNCLWRKKNSE